MRYAFATLLPWLAACAPAPDVRVLNATCDAPPCHTQVRGLRVDPLIAPAHAEEAATLQSELAVIEAACPTFAERFVWLACDESPCLLFLWPEAEDTPHWSQRSWSEQTCGASALPVSSFAAVSNVDDRRIVENYVYKVGDAPSPEDHDLLSERAIAIWVTGPVQQAYVSAIADAK